ncbi:MAG: hypothetical protein CLLPBCKN_004800 [Chroococcidiopsis cubana SAG 39.79]|nr:hypothetical protein [Chroococcidiopsis cubana SAG 39.79]
MVVVKFLVSVYASDLYPSSAENSKINLMSIFAIEFLTYVFKTSF